MRKSIYFKDDDDRLSFLLGNYITLTNLTEHDVERILRMHISPINISVHTTDPELRVRMMRNPDAGSSLEKLRRLARGGATLHT
ncbi:MAG: radical SAM protein, partial [Oscillospiraceae bacterium]